jgi:hypothetical protein
MVSTNEPTLRYATLRRLQIRFWPHTGDGTLLDHSMIVYGSGLSDGNRHLHENLPTVLAGRGCGTLKTGRHVKYSTGTPMANLFVAMLDRMGVPTDKMGDSDGELGYLADL